MGEKSVWQYVCLVARRQRPRSNTVGVCVCIFRKRRVPASRQSYSSCVVSRSTDEIRGYIRIVCLRLHCLVRFAIPTLSRHLFFSLVVAFSLFLSSSLTVFCSPSCRTCALCHRLLAIACLLQSLWSSPNYHRCASYTSTRHVHAERVMAERRGCHVVSRATPNRWNVSLDNLCFLTPAFFSRRAFWWHVLYARREAACALAARFSSAFNSSKFFIAAIFVIANLNSTVYARSRQS